jgi:hypothetical protein
VDLEFVHEFKPHATSKSNRLRFGKSLGGHAEQIQLLARWLAEGADAQGRDREH